MAKKRRKPRSRPRSQSGLRSDLRTAERAAPSRSEPEEEAARRTGRTQPGTNGPRARGVAAASERTRAEKKVLARRAREAALKRARRQHAYRRAVQIGIVAIVALGVVLFVTRGESPGDVPDAALRAAETAGCGDIRSPTADPQGGHLGAGETLVYDQHPATSGRHDPSPLPGEPHVYTSPVEETAAVHNLEHAYVLLYYRAEGADALPQEVVDELARLAEAEDKVILAPHPSLNDGTSLAVAAWNKLWECPSDVGPAEARTIASGFIEAYRGTSNAPEPNAA